MALSDDYFEYLYHLMRADLPEHRKYSTLLSELYDIPFTYSHPMDENRVVDALDMRREFLFDKGYDTRDDFMDRDVSVLEILAALSRRIEIEVTGEPGYDVLERWFWVCLENLGLLDPGCGEDTRYDRGLVRYKIDVWMYRQYDKHGKGGIFPVKKSDIDEREIDIWYQGQLYLAENWEI